MIPLPTKRTGWLAEWCNLLLDCVAERTILASPDIQPLNTGRGISLVLRRRDAARAGFSGTAYIAGNKTTGLASDSAKPWVRCFLGSGSAEENAGPPPNPLPYGEEWYEKANTYGDIHITRA